MVRSGTPQLVPRPRRLAGGRPGSLLGWEAWASRLARGAEPNLHPGARPVARTLVASFLLAVLLASPAAAQQEKGDTELEFTGSLITTVGAGESSGIGIVQSKLGQFVTDRWELGAFPSLEVRFGEGTTDTRLGFGLFAVYSFLRTDAMTVPYAGASYYKSDLTASFDENDSWLGVNAGLKFYVRPEVALDVGGNYHFGLQGQEGGLFILQVGLSFLF